MDDIVIRAVEKVVIYLKQDIPTYENSNKKFIYDENVSHICYNNTNVEVMYDNDCVDIYNRSDIILMELTMKKPQE